MHRSLSRCGYLCQVPSIQQSLTVVLLILTLQKEPDYLFPSSLGLVTLGRTEEKQEDCIVIKVHCHFVQQRPESNSPNDYSYGKPERNAFCNFMFLSRTSSSLDKKVSPLPQYFSVIDRHSASLLSTPPPREMLTVLSWMVCIDQCVVTTQTY